MCGGVAGRCSPQGVTGFWGCKRSRITGWVLMALIQREGRVAKLSDDPTHVMGSSALASVWGCGQCLSPAELLVLTLIHGMVPS